MARRNPVNAANPFANVTDPIHQAIMREERTWITRVDPKERAKQLKALARKEARRKLKPILKAVEYETAKADFIKRNASLGMTPVRFELLRAKFVELTKLPEFREIVNHRKPGLELFVQTKLTQKVPTPFTNPVTGATEIRLASAVNVPTQLIHPFATFAVHNANNYPQLLPSKKSLARKKK
ncbi:MAG: hypothetical protein WCW44_06060 [archaeon]|jgi:hypothetical protein